MCPYLRSNGKVGAAHRLRSVSALILRYFSAPDSPQLPRSAPDPAATVCVLDPSAQGSPFQQRQALEAEYVAALKWCRAAPAGTKRGAKAALKENMFKNVKRGTLHSLLVGGHSAVPMDKRFLLTTDEEALFVNWLKQCAVANKARDRDQMSAKVVEILGTRAKGGRKWVPSTNQGRALKNSGKLTQNFFNGFYKRHAGFLKQCIPREEEARRMQQMVEEVTEVHFEGKYGIRATCLAAGIMEPDGVIADLSRMLNMDEMPQFMDYATLKGNTKRKFAGVPGHASQSAKMVRCSPRPRPRPCSACSRPSTPAPSPCAPAACRATARL